MMKRYQVTLFCADGAYKPVACIVNHEQATNDDLSKDRVIRNKLQVEGVKKICNKRYWSLKDLQHYKYTKFKIRAVEE